MIVPQPYSFVDSAPSLLASISSVHGQPPALNNANAPAQYLALSSSSSSRLHQSTPLWLSIAAQDGSSFGSLGTGISRTSQSTALLVATVQPAAFSSDDFVSDRIVRVDENGSILLRRSGFVSLAGVKLPKVGTSNSVFPDCVSSTPVAKLQQMLPVREDVWFQRVAGDGRSTRVVLVRMVNSRTDTVKKASIVNESLLESGWALVRTSDNTAVAASSSILSVERLQSLQQRARERQIGLFQTCQDSFQAEFEPLDLTTEIQWGEDGGKQVLRRKEAQPTSPPKNPGDVKGCSDFGTYEDALRWYENYFPFYGDVAKLDRDNDGVPCPGLAHTTNPDRYRMKKPSK
jgi:hypothetical protein